MSYRGSMRVSSRRFVGNAAVQRDGLVERGARFRALRFGEGLGARAPKLLDDRDAPERAVARRADGPAAHFHVHRVGVQLRKLPERDPAAGLDGQVEAQLMNLP